MSMPAPEETPRRSNPLHLALAFASGGLLTLMAHFNGTLGFHGGPLFASWTAHATGTVAALVFLAILALLSRGKRAGQSQEKKTRAPLWAYLGGTLGVIFVASGSWLIVRIGATNTALLVTGGQLVFGIVLDLMTGHKPVLWASALGVVFILAGAALAQRR